MLPEVVGATALSVVILLGLLIKNIGFLAPIYGALLNLKTSVVVGVFKISKPLLLKINDGLTAIFFLQVLKI